MPQFVTIGLVTINLAHLAILERVSNGDGTYKVIAHMAIPHSVCVEDDRRGDQWASYHTELEFYGTQAQTLYDAVRGVTRAEKAVKV